MILHAMSSNFAWSRNNAEYHWLYLLLQYNNLPLQAAKYHSYKALQAFFGNLAIAV